MSEATRNDQGRTDGWFFAVALFFLSLALLVKAIMETAGQSIPKLVPWMGPVPTLIVLGGLAILGAIWFLRGSVQWPFRKVLALMLVALPLSGLLALMNSSGDPAAWGGFTGERLSSVLPKSAAIVAWGIALALNLVTVAMAIRLAFSGPPEGDESPAVRLAEALGKRTEAPVLRERPAPAMAEAAPYAAAAGALLGGELPLDTARETPPEHSGQQAGTIEEEIAEDADDEAFFRPSFLVEDEEEEAPGPNRPLRAHEDPRRVLAGALREETPVEPMEPVRDLLEAEDGYYSSEDMAARYARIQSREAGEVPPEAPTALEEAAAGLLESGPVLAGSPWVQASFAEAAGEEMPGRPTEAGSAGLDLEEEELDETEEEEEDWEGAQEEEDWDGEGEDIEGEEEDGEDWEEEDDREDAEDGEEESVLYEDEEDDEEADEDEDEEERFEDEALPRALGEGELEDGERDGDRELEAARSALDEDGEEEAAATDGALPAPRVEAGRPPAAAAGQAPPLFPDILSGSSRRDPAGSAGRARRVAPQPGSDTLFTHRSEVPEHVYRNAVRMVVEEDRCSQAMLQRGLGISFSEANSIIERMSDEGLLGPPLASGRRDVLAGKAGTLEQAGS